jgi:uncharacterized protein YggE
MLSVLSILALAAGQAAPVNPNVPHIVVEGFDQARNPPDAATLSYDVHGEGKTSDQAVTALVAKAAAVENALRSMDPSIELHSQSVRVQAARGNDCKVEEYEETLRLSAGECAILGYVAKQDFDVRTSSVSDAGTMVGLAGRHGAIDPKIEGFRLADDREARRQAIAAALTNARDKAQAIAAGSSARLGEVLSVSLDGAAVQEIIITGSRALRSNYQGTPIAVKVDPGPVETTARVTVNYAIDR